VGAEILRGVEVALGAVDGNRERPNPNLLDILIFKAADVSGEMPIIGRKIVQVEAPD
jgi:hypothetical protein